MGKQLRDAVTSIEQRLAIEHGATQALADSASLAEAAPKIIAAVCETLGWQCGSYRAHAPEEDTMRFVASWGVGTSGVAEFLKSTRNVVQQRSSGGLIRRAWLGGEAIWVRDVTEDPTFRRGEAALKAGLRSAFCVPVKASGKVIGVMEFFSESIHQPDAGLLDCMKYVASHIGQFIQRTEAQESLRRFRVALDNSADMIVLIDRKTMRYVDVNETACRLLGYTKEELLSLGPQDVLPASREQLERAYDEFIANPASVHGMLSHYRRKDGSTFPFESTRHVIRSGDSYLIAAISRDITERKQADERIQYLATHDALTELPNRVMFGQLLHHAIDSAKRYKRSFAVLFIDLDRFKLINDTLGHEAGDELLRVISARLKTTLRASDVVARLGGDEFVVLVQEVGDTRQVTAVARKILSAVMKPVMIAGHECRVTTSIGISMYPADATEERTLMKNADLAMYLAKEEGKNNFQFYSKDIKSQSLERMALETSLRRALERREFSLQYQAKQDLKSGAITGVEALLRWHSPGLGQISPAQFIPLAEETGLIVPIGKWVLRTACAQSVAWQRAGLPPVRMAVNLSPRQFADPDLLHDIAAICRDTGMRSNLLELEITEGMVMHNPERAIQVLRAIKEMGVRLAIDDFGTGYSSLAQLKRFPIDTLKVDRSFIRDIPRDADDKAITEAIIAMGKTLSLTVVAEGVETAEQQAFLRDHACDQMQGYYFSKPVAPEQFADLLRKHTS